jgi:hypothetical protein
MEAPASASPSNRITSQEWTWVQNLIRDVQREEMCDAFAKNLWQWDLVVKQFRRVEFARIICGAPTKSDFEAQAICLHALIATGRFLALEARKFTGPELGKFGVTQEQIEADVASLEQSLRERHHAIPESELKAVREKIFGVAA